LTEEKKKPNRGKTGWTSISQKENSGNGQGVKQIGDGGVIKRGISTLSKEGDVLSGRPENEL